MRHCTTAEQWRANQTLSLLSDSAKILTVATSDTVIIVTIVMFCKCVNKLSVILVVSLFNLLKCYFDECCYYCLLFNLKHVYM